MQSDKNGGFDRKDQEPLVEPLSEREIEILELIADNLSKREIAEMLSLAYSTVKWYTQQIYQKLGVNGRRKAVLRARELGLLKSLVVVVNDQAASDLIQPGAERQGSDPNSLGD